MGEPWQSFAEQARANHIDEFMSGVSKHLDSLVRTATAQDIVALDEDPDFRQVRDLAHQDPYTRRGYLKPRGYAGDAVLLDYIYGTAPASEDTTKLGAGILEWGQTKSAAFAAVRNRKELLAKQMQGLLESKTNSRCLSVACGHLRELAMTRASASGSISVVALDQDPLSLAVVKATYGSAVETVRASIRRLIIEGGSQLGKFDLITVAGLYDYLGEPAAIALTTKLSEQLNPGGRLFIANFVDSWERGYMECLMKWHLIYRSPDQLQNFTNDLDSRFSSHTFVDHTNTIAYLEVERADQ